MYRLLHKRNTGNSILRSIFIAAFFFSFHYTFITYVNSTLLQTITDLSSVGMIYASGAFITICTFLIMPKLITKFGTYKTMLFLGFGEILFLSFLAFSTHPTTILIAFILHHAINPLIFLCLDVDIEELAEEKSMGKIRGIFLSLINLAYVVSAFTTGLILENFQLQTVYAISLLFMVIFMFYSFRSLRDLPRCTFTKISTKSELKEFWQNKPVRTIGIVNFTLHFFYVWMVIYIPIYLTQTIGFSWGEVGLILSIALIPFVILEAPVGELADKKYGEKEFILVGFILIIISLLAIYQYKGSVMIVWTLILFVSRIGASLVETASEAFFFKKAENKDELISIYRIGSPLAFIIGPIVGSMFLPFEIPTMFGILSILIVFAFFKTISLKDTK